MSSLSSKSAQEITDLLDEYGIKHGPVVDSTRNLYERKLKEAMAKRKKVKPSSDQTYYREEEEEVTYLYRTPVSISLKVFCFVYITSLLMNSECDHCEVREKQLYVCLFSGSYLRSRPEWTAGEHETSYSSYPRSQPEYRGRDYANEPYMYDTPSTYRSSYLKSAPTKMVPDAPQTPESSRLIPLWVQLVFFLAVAVFLYIIFSSMENNESLQGIE
ncbi:emerin [Tautogolabrus adspersus]